MDSLTTFDPSETSGFITINAIRLKKVSPASSFWCRGVGGFLCWDRC